MSYDPNDYNGHDSAREERESWEGDREAYHERIEAFNAGLCSYRAAVAGGAEYLRDLAETALELKQAGCAIPSPIAAASVARTSASRRGRSAA
jgi:hypothetical protein